MEYYSAMKRTKWCCSYMDEARYYHTKWSNLEKDKHHMISLYVECNKNDTNECIYKTETDLSTSKQTFGYQRGKVVGGIH